MTATIQDYKDQMLQQAFIKNAQGQSLTRADLGLLRSYRWAQEIKEGRRCRELIVLPARVGQ